MDRIVYSKGPSGMPMMVFGSKQIKYGPNDKVFAIFEKKQVPKRGGYVTDMLFTFKSLEEAIEYAESEGYKSDYVEIVAYINEIKLDYSAGVFDNIDFGSYGILKNLKISIPVFKQIQKYGINSKQTKALIKLFEV